MRNFSLKEITLPFTLTLAVAANYCHGTPVLVIDEGADLKHPTLQSRSLVNAAEDTGTAGTDDDHNGFVDDVAGWNAISNDGEYFPLRVRAIFEGNLDRVKNLFALYSEAEQGNADALRAIQSNPMAARAIQSLVSASHGTHVSGIVVAQFQKEKPFIQSYNVFTPSKEPSDPDSFEMNRPHAASALEKEAYSTSFMKPFATLILQDGPMATTFSTTPGSVFDDFDNFSPLFVKASAQLTERAERMKAYMTAHPQGVANLSLGFTKPLYVKNLNQMWVAELKKRNMDPMTLRSPEQEKVFQALADKLVELNKIPYQTVFAAFPNTLFVVAAGNDGDPSDANAGNNDQSPVWPANFSKEFPNVISIAAVDNQGVITDFSNFGLTSVNVGAPGKSIRSTAPAGLDVVMSGTSMAAPYVTGLAARLRTLNSSLTAAQVRVLLEKTARRSPSLNGKCTTGAYVDPDSAAQAAITARDTPFEKAIESTMSVKSIFARRFVMADFRSMLSPRQEPTKTPKMIRDLMRGIFYK